MMSDVPTSESSASSVVNNSASIIGGGGGHCSVAGSASTASTGVSKMSSNGGMTNGATGANGVAVGGGVGQQAMVNGSTNGGRNAPYSSVSSLMNFNVYDRWSNNGSGSSSIASNPGFTLRKVYSDTLIWKHFAKIIFLLIKYP